MQVLTSSSIFRFSGLPLSYVLPRMLLLLLLFFGISPASASDTELVLLHGAETANDELWPIGQDLFVKINTNPNTLIHVTLRDESNHLIASHWVDSGPSGTIESLLLWSLTGVVGCDPIVTADPSLHRFQSFEQAEAILSDRSFKIYVMDLEGTVLATSGITMTANRDPQFFFSDESGCLRTSFSEHENIYLSARNAAPDMQDTALFLIEAEGIVPPVGSTIREIRSPFVFYPQTIPPKVGNGTWTVLLWEGADTKPGNYGVIVRWFTGTAEYVIQPDDFIVGAFGRSQDIIIADTGCTDPDC